MATSVFPGTAGGVSVSREFLGDACADWAIEVPVETDDHSKTLSDLVERRRIQNRPALHIRKYYCLLSTYFQLGN